MHPDIKEQSGMPVTEPIDYEKELAHKDYQIQDLTIKLINCENNNKQLVDALQEQETQYLVLVGKTARELLANK